MSQRDSTACDTWERSIPVSSLSCHTKKERACVTKGLLGDGVTCVRLADEHDVLLGKVYERLRGLQG